MNEYLKQEMNPNFRMTNPLNPVHMMSFSKAQRNTSQVHQINRYERISIKSLRPNYL